MKQGLFFIKLRSHHNRNHAQRPDKITIGVHYLIAPVIHRLLSSWSRGFLKSPDPRPNTARKSSFCAIDRPLKQAFSAISQTPFFYPFGIRQDYEIGFDWLCFFCASPAGLLPYPPFIKDFTSIYRSDKLALFFQLSHDSKPRISRITRILVVCHSCENRNPLA